MNNDPCKKCGLSDRYVKGKFSYCRPCHNEMQKRYLQRKAQGANVEVLQPPARKLSELLTSQPDNPRCPQGHLMSGSNVRIASQRKGKHLERKCRACERNRKRVTYGLQPEPAPTRLTELLDD
jgi:hypothetical protein